MGRQRGVMASSPCEVATCHFSNFGIFSVALRSSPARDRGIYELDRYRPLTNRQSRINSEIIAFFCQCGVAVNNIVWRGEVLQNFVSIRALDE